MASGIKPTHKLTLGFSPCPNDTFIFYALINKRIDTGPLEFEPTIRDVEELNNLALKGIPDITKVSFHTFGYLRDRYRLLKSGGALGRGCGPLIITSKGLEPEDLKSIKIAVPGFYTTACLLLRLFEPALKRKSNIVSMPFYKIMTSVQKGEVDAGVIIHESRFTYHEYGLKEVIDLGAWWESKTGLPIPLGCIIMKNELGEELSDFVENLLRESIDFAYKNRDETKKYIKEYARELNNGVIDSHINLYVNDFTFDYGEEGSNAIDRLFEMAKERELFQ